MFGRNKEQNAIKKEQKIKRLNEELEEAIDLLEAKNREIKELGADKAIQIKTMEHDRKVEIEDIKHMTKMAKERVELEKQQEIMKLTMKHAEQIADIKDGYRDKLEAQLKKETDNIKEMYTAILQRLPNLNAKLNIKE